ncbi:MAG: Txe/YoeB family addiction module toxin [Mariprofundaceae bacterium]
MNWHLIYTKKAQKDARLLAESALKKKAEGLLAMIEHNPHQTLPAYEKLIGDLSGAYSRRINIQHQLIYQVYEHEKVIKIIRMWTHYE